MPTYEYRCEKCGEKFSKVENISEHGSSRTLCPKCRSERVEQLMSPFVAQTSRKS